MLLVKLAQLLKYNRPSFGLLVSVLDPRYWVAVSIVERNVGEFLAPLAINWIFEALKERRQTEGFGSRNVSHKGCQICASEKQDN